MHTTILRLLTASTLLIIPILALAQSQKFPATNPPGGHGFVTPEQLIWKPLIADVEIAVVSGDPEKKGGIYVIRIRSKVGAKVPPHWHPTDEHITVLEGSFWIAHGEKFDPGKLHEVKVGGHITMPAHARHFGRHGADNVIEVYGEAPFVVNFVNPEDDPKRPKNK